MTITSVWNNYPEVKIVTDSRIVTISLDDEPAYAMLAMYARRMGVKPEHMEIEDVIEEMVAACPIEI